MLFRQFVDEDLGCASYLVGDADAGEALLIDPAYAIEQYLVAPSRRACGSCACWRRTRTPTMCPATAGWRSSTGSRSPSTATPGAGYPHEPLEDGGELTAGSVTARTIHTPGHRPEHCCFLVDGTLFTGDSLFVGTVARPDLAVEAREGAEGMFRSLHGCSSSPTTSRSSPATSQGRCAVPG